MKKKKIKTLEQGRDSDRQQQKKNEVIRKSKA